MELNEVELKNETKKNIWVLKVINWLDEKNLNKPKVRGSGVAPDRRARFPNREGGFLAEQMVSV